MTVRVEACAKCGEPVLVEVHHLAKNFRAELVLRCERCAREREQDKRLRERAQERKRG